MPKSSSDVTLLPRFFCKTKQMPHCQTARLSQIQPCCSRQALGQQDRRVYSATHDLDCHHRYLGIEAVRSRQDKQLLVLCLHTPIDPVIENGDTL